MAPRLGPDMIQRAMEGVGDRFRSSYLYNQDAYRELSREKDSREIVVRDNKFHIREAIEWIKRAQDSTPDKGVSRAYSVAWNVYFRSRGWQPSYPETTGYIIPTLFDCATYFADPDLKSRALEMADWEIDVQMENGAVMGGTINPSPSPAVFNTGQVMLGWLRAYQETNEEKYLLACQRAGDFLLDAQSPEGGWVKGNSRFADAKATTYNSRVGWALLLLGKEIQHSRYLDAGDKNIRYSIGRQNTNGWFRDNCLTDSQAPLLHTICYAIEGILGAAEALQNESYFNKARLGATALLSCLRENGSVAGRLDSSWRGTVEWSCLTGDAQLAGIFLRIYVRTREIVYLTAARRLLKFMKATQNCTTKDPGLRGGIKGSYPFDGNYGRFELLNWATKFYVDALLLDEQLDPQAGDRTHL